jgi:lipoprotein-anchoring transpeptidase ErfK/SrfK
VTLTVAAILTAFALQQPATPAPLQLPPDLALQVMLDRAGFSPGTIDGHSGKNTRRALEAYRKLHGVEPAGSDPAVIAYTITPHDAQGPFAPSIPEDMVEKSKLPSLGYTSVLEAIAERFHATPALLQKLNPGAAFEAGSTIQVPNVEPLQIPVAEPEPTQPREQAGKNGTQRPTGTTGRGAAGEAPNPLLARPDVVVTVKESTSDLTVTDAQGKVIMYAPVTTGSSNDPLPIGTWKVNGLQLNPKFRYNPDLFWDSDPSHTKATLPAGPNNPVGVVWIDISKPHYGLHGTPEPSTIGRTESHGCVRLTNWDALKLAGLVKPGTKVVFEK